MLVDVLRDLNSRDELVGPIMSTASQVTCQTSNSQTARHLSPISR